MKIYLVSFKVASIQKKQRLIEAIKQFGTWGRIQDDVWLVGSDKTAVEVRDDLAVVLEATDTVFVLKSAAEAAWRNVAASSEWLQKYL